MFVSIKTINNTIQVKTQYNPSFKAQAKLIGGRFNSDEKCWEFDVRNEDLVKEMLLSIFGTDGYDQSVVDVEITVKDEIRVICSPIYIAGRKIADATGRDSGAKVCDKIVFVDDYPISGGSRGNWATIIPEDSVFRILDLYVGALEKLDRRGFEYKIISKNSSKDEELAKLRNELVRIKARIAELEA